MDGKAHSYSSVSEPRYEPVGSGKPQTTEEQPRHLEGGNEAARRGLNPISEISEENARVMVNSSYELIELGEHSDISKGVHLEMVPRVDSMVDNTAYSRESHGGQTSAVTNNLEAGGEGGEYEATIM